MRVLIAALSVLTILAGVDAASAGPSTARRDLSTAVEPAAVGTASETEAAATPETTPRAAPHQVHHRGTAHAHRIGGPVGLVGGMVAGLFGRR